MVPSNPTPESLLPLPAATFHILLAVAAQDRHGYAIIQEVAARTDEEVRLSAGTLYRSIQRMVELDLIEETAERPAADLDDERRRYYRITGFGREVARAEAARLQALVQLAHTCGLAPREGLMRAWQVLLHLFPASLREAHAEEMTAMLARDLARTRGLGRVGVARASASRDLRHGARVFGPRGTERLRGLFVIGEVAAATVLLVTVGLFLKALWRSFGQRIVTRTAADCG